MTITSQDSRIETFSFSLIKFFLHGFRCASLTSEPPPSTFFVLLKSAPADRLHKRASRRRTGATQDVRVLPYVDALRSQRCDTRVCTSGTRDHPRPAVHTHLAAVMGAWFEAATVRALQNAPTLAPASAHASRIASRLQVQADARAACGSRGSPPGGAAEGRAPT
eukprot:CAMPEP_0119372148 /NCGR_PEP_ID=MMETSP1334-20130426/18182_1 /TAXON_ID=127549 /ORGANISM="Calcidiscus leptoporus, Strain RCC1130" /LENGTH=164 /DNA_ID=CAMNT_0007389565 /DNA_START=162 /DNA_END=653 /DNA_ORIENTATION=-